MSLHQTKKMEMQTQVTSLNLFAVILLVLDLTDKLN